MYRIKSSFFSSIYQSSFQYLPDNYFCFFGQCFSLLSSEIINIYYNNRIQLGFSDIWK